MIVDQLNNAHRYYHVHNGFEEAFEFLKRFDGQHFEQTRIQLDGTRLIAIIEPAVGRGRQKSPLEAHRKYIDIQYSFEGNEEIGWKPYQDCLSVSQSYNEEKDIEFFSDVPAVWLPVPARSFAIFFPEDAHAPLAGVTAVKKIIMKIES